MASLEELRAQLGSVDDKIVELYEERMKLCEEIGICKSGKRNLPVIVEMLSGSCKRNIPGLAGDIP